MITANRAHVTQAMALAATVVERRNSIPVLGTLRTVANGSLAFEGSDLDTFTRAEVPYEGGHASFCLYDPRAVLAVLNHGGQAVRMAPDTETANRIAITSGDFAGRLATLPVEDHPGAELVEHEVWGADIGAAELAQIARLMPSISTEETRYYLNGVCAWKLAGTEWTWRFASTDGHRLCFVDIPLPGATGELPDGLIIPRRFLQIALARMARSREPIRLSFGPHRLRNDQGVELALEQRPKRFSLSTTIGAVRFTMATKLIDGKFPDVMRVVPSDIPIAARMKRADLAKAVTALSSLTREKLRAVRLTFDQPGKITISLNTPDLGEGSYTIAAEHNAKPGFFIGYNGRYLIEMCGALRGEEMLLQMLDAGAPALITDPADTAFTGVLMPMRV